MDSNQSQVARPTSGLPHTVDNPWSKEFTHKDFSTAHKIQSTLPKRWELHKDSPLMLKPLIYTAVEQVPNAEIAKCSSWLEAFATGSAHSSTISATSLEAVYNFMQKVVTIWLCSSVVKDSFENDIWSYMICSRDPTQRS